MSQFPLEGTGASTVAGRAIEFMHRHLDEPISVNDIAEATNYSQFHFSRVFASQARIPPSKYLAALRFHRAKQLLLYDQMATVDAMTAVGYSSLATFTRQFGQAVGTTPGRFRRLADQVAETSQHPFAIQDRSAPVVRVTLVLPDHGLRTPPMVWLGWYAQPAPIGLPQAGQLVRGTQTVRLHLCPGAGWLLGFAVDPNAEPGEHLAPNHPMVAVHPAPVRHSEHITLRFGAGPDVPLLSALPVLASR